MRCLLVVCPAAAVGVGAAVGPGSSDVTQDGYHDVAEVSRVSLCMRSMRSSVTGQGSWCLRAGSQPGLACPYPSAVARACQPPHAMKISIGGPRCQSVAAPNLPKAWNRSAAYGEPWRSRAVDASRCARKPCSDAVAGSPCHCLHLARNLAQALKYGPSVVICHRRMDFSP